MKKITIILLLLLLSTTIVFSAKPFSELFYPVSREEKRLCSSGITTRFEFDSDVSEEKFFNIFLSTGATLQAYKKTTPEDYLYEISWYFKNTKEVQEIKIEYFDGFSWKQYDAKRVPKDQVWTEYRAEYSEIDMQKFRFVASDLTLTTKVVEVS